MKDISKINRHKSVTVKETTAKEKKDLPFSPKYKYSEIPPIVQKYAMLRTIFAGVGIIVFAVIALANLNPRFLFGSLAILIVWAYAMFQKVIPFMYDYAVFFDAVVVEQTQKQISIPVGKLAKQAMSGGSLYLIAKRDNDYYKITIPRFREEYNAGAQVMVYFRKGERYEHNPNYFIILEPMFIDTKTAVVR